MSTLLILVVVGLSIVAVTLAVVAEPDKPATERRWNLRGRHPRSLAVVAPAPAVAPADAPAVEAPATAGAAPVRTRQGEPYQPPRWWQRLRSIVLIVIVTTIIGATVAAILGVTLALIGLGVREAVS